MKSFRFPIALTLVLLAFASQLSAQTTATATASVAVGSNAPAPRVNTAIVPVSREGGATNRQALVLKRAKENPGPCDIVFIGDSITQGWEGNGKNVWEKFYGNRKCLNFGVGGDRTQHVLWRLGNGQLDGIRPKVAVLMIGTNNSNKDDNTEKEILIGVIAIINELMERCPDAKILVLGIFPRGETFNAQRGKIAQVNQALSKIHNGQAIFYQDLSQLFMDRMGAIPREIMPDYLHLSEKGYTIWAEAIEPKLKELMAMD